MHCLAIDQNRLTSDIVSQKVTFAPMFYTRIDNSSVIALSKQKTQITLYLHGGIATESLDCRQTKKVLIGGDIKWLETNTRLILDGLQPVFLDEVTKRLSSMLDYQ